MTAHSEPVRITRDVYGRRYRVGESDIALTGRPRVWMLRLAWLAMVAVSLFQYGFAALLPRLGAAGGWSMLLFGAWVVCQAGVALPAARLFQRRRHRLLIPGALLCGLALVTLAHAQSLPVLLLGWSLAGGIGSGLVYIACLGTAAEWYPERLARATGFVSGGFGYGAVPFVLLAGVVPATGALLDGAAVVVTGLVLAAGLLLVRPPEHWWPEHLDPREWAVNRRLNRSFPNNMPALRPFTLTAAVRTGMLPLMFVVVVLSSAMAFFDLVYLATGPMPVVSLVVLAVATGLGRDLSGWLSDRLGRRRILAAALAIGGLAQFGLLTGGAPAFFGALAGAGTGAGYSLLVALVRDWFGDEAALTGYGLAYAGKAVGGVAGLALAAAGSSLVVVVVGSLGLVGALLAFRLRQPGRPVLSRPGW